MQCVSQWLTLVLRRRRVLDVADEMKNMVKTQGASDLLKGKVRPVAA